MAENNTSETSGENQTDLDAKVIDEPKETNKLPRSGPSSFLLLINFVLLLGVSGLSYVIWLQQERLNNLLLVQENLESENNNLSTRLVATEEQLTGLDSLNSSTETLLNQQNARLDSLNEELAVLRLGLNSSQGDATTLMLIEAASLLRLAEQYLLLTQDLSMARSLYQRSMNLLGQVDDPAVNRISTMVTADIAALDAAPEVDIQGIYLRLDDISGQIDSLSFVNAVEPSSEFQNPQSRSGLDEFSNNVAGFFSRFFTIRKLNEPLEIPLNNQEIIILRQNLQTQLEQAKLAALQKRQDIYQDSISNVLRLIQQNATDTNGQKNRVLSGLRSLQTENVVLETPRLSNALGLLESLLANRTPEQ